MSGYTPSIEFAKSEYAWARFEIRGTVTADSHAQFDRMISEVRAEAWAEGYAAGQDSIYTATDEWPNPACVNPYRAALGLTAEQEGGTE